jgi:alcohol dehydrogenase class IV
MAFANAFLGVCHSMAHKLGGTHHVPHGLANALLISHVIRYNATGECGPHSRLAAAPRTYRPEPHKTPS